MTPSYLLSDDQQISYAPGNVQQANVRDGFAAAAFNNNGPDNTTTWTAAWTETDAGGAGVGAGYVRVVAGTGLTFQGIAGTPGTGSQVVRSVNLTNMTVPAGGATVNLTSNGTVNLTYDFNRATLEATDTVVVEIGPTAAGPFTVLNTLSGTSAIRRYVHDVSGYVAAATTVRIRITGGFAEADDQAIFDNIDVGTTDAVLPCNHASNDGRDDGVYVTPSQDNTIFFVDKDGDGVPDGDASIEVRRGNLVLSSVTTSLGPGYRADRLDSLYITGSNTGTAATSLCNLTGSRIFATSPFAMAYGENPNLADAAQGADFGYTVLPDPGNWMDLALTVDKTTSKPVLSTTAGDTAGFTLVVNSHEFDLTTMTVQDTLPPNWAYVAGSTTITYPNGTTAGPSGTLDPFPQKNVRDQFGAAAYNNNNGTSNWATNWAENADDANAAAGFILITGGALRFRQNAATPGNTVSITRTADFTNMLPQLGFRYSSSINLGGVNNTLVLEACTSAACGGGWTTLATFTNGVPDVSPPYDLSAFAAAGTAIRFRFTAGFDTANEFLDIFNVDITAPLTWNATRGSLPAMLPNQTLTISFTGQTTAAFTNADVTRNNVQAVGTRTVGSVTQTFKAKSFAFNTYSNATSAMTITKANNPTLATPVSPGDTIAYTIAITNPNTSSANLTGVSLVDALPVGVTLSGTVSLDRSTVADKFDVAAYTNNNGTAAWVNMMLHTERATREGTRAFVRYDDLLTDWTVPVFRLGQELDVTLGLLEIFLPLFLEVFVDDALDPRIDDVDTGGAQARHLGIVGLDAFVQHHRELRAQLPPQCGRVQRGRVRDDLHDALVTHLVAVAVRAVEHVAAPALAETFDGG